MKTGQSLKTIRLLRLPGSNRLRGFTQNLELLMLSLPVMIYLFIFSYIPMAGIIVAFKDFRYDKGIFGSDWAPEYGLRNFKFLFSTADGWRIFKNTVLMNLLFIFAGLVVSVVMALMLYQITRRVYLKVYQTIAIIPNFISWVVAGFAFYAVFSTQYGLTNSVTKMLGMEAIDWYSDPGYWPVILAFASIWKYAGMSTVIYFAALMGIDKEYFEAAEIDGANRFQVTWRIMLPFLQTTIVILTIMSIGNILRADFGMFFQLTRDVPMLYPVTDVIDTYVFRALKKGNMASSSAAGFFQSVVGFILVLVTNKIVHKINPENSLF